MCASTSSFGRGLDSSLSTKALIESGRFIDDPVSISPDGNRYVVRLVRGDLGRNGIWLEVIFGSLTASGHAPRMVRIFQSGLSNGRPFGGPDTDSSAAINPVRWLGNDRIAFLWHDATHTRQVFEVDLDRGVSRQLTASATNVEAFDISQRGIILYQADDAEDPIEAEALQQQKIDAGFTVSDSTDGAAVVKGDYSGRSILDTTWNTRWFVKQDSGKAQAIDIGEDQPDRALPGWGIAQLSPDGKAALVSLQPQIVPEGWQRYGGGFAKRVIDDLRRNKDSDLGRRAIQLFVFDLTRRTARPLWNAATWITASAAWSPDGHRIAVAPTYLPPQRATAAGLAGRSAAVVDVTTGSYQVLPLDYANADSGNSNIVVRWKANDRLELKNLTAGTVADVVLDHATGRWIAHAPSTRVPKTRNLEITIGQDLATPPKLIAKNRRSGKKTILFDPNPGLKGITDSGATEALHGSLATGERWSATLFYPLGRQSLEPVPLLIENVGARPTSDEFTLTGWQNGGGLGPPLIPVYPGRLLAERNIAVVALSISGPSGPREGPRYLDVCKSVIDRLVAQGLVDRTRIGLAGHSRTGFLVEYALTHPHFPVAAALVSDNFDTSYGQALLSDWSADSAYVVGAPAFGSGLQRWLKESTSLNAGAVKTPLEIVTESELRTSLLYAWDLFSRLRHLGRPVELFAMPMSDRYPAHDPQNPRQIQVLMQRSVDWFDFWLNGHEDHDPSKREQYASWEKLCDLQRSVRPSRPSFCVSSQAP